MMTKLKMLMLMMMMMLMVIDANHPLISPARYSTVRAGKNRPDLTTMNVGQNPFRSRMKNSVRNRNRKRNRSLLERKATTKKSDSRPKNLGESVSMSPDSELEKLGESVKTIRVPVFDSARLAVSDD